MAIASVPIQLIVIFFKTQLFDQTYNPVSDWFDVEAVVAPGVLNRDRYSRMFLRKSLFTPTTPNAQALLYVPEKKNGIVTQLPVL